MNRCRLGSTAHGAKGNVRRQGRSASIRSASSSSAASDPGRPTSCTAQGAPESSVPNGTDIAGQPVRFHGGVNGEYAEFATTLRSQPRSCQGPAAGERRASAGVSRTSYSVKNGSRRPRSRSRPPPAATRPTKRRPRAACTRVRLVSSRRSRSRASTDVPAVQWVRAVTPRDAG
ncbi:hypothetical protein STENM36S_02923 [Streptomyces tendae]